MINRKQIYGALVKISQAETGKYQTGGIVKTGSPGAVNSFGVSAHINTCYGQAVFSQVRRYFTGALRGPLYGGARLPDAPDAGEYGQ